MESAAAFFRSSPFPARRDGKAIVGSAVDEQQRFARVRAVDRLGPLGADRTIGELLVAHGFDLDVPIRAQETPLTRACRADKGEHPEPVRALLELGADPNAPNARGRTALSIATGARFSRTVALLLAAGAR